MAALKQDGSESESDNGATTPTHRSMTGMNDNAAKRLNDLHQITILLICSLSVFFLSTPIYLDRMGC